MRRRPGDAMTAALARGDGPGDAMTAALARGDGPGDAMTAALATRDALSGTLGSLGFDCGFVGFHRGDQGLDGDATIGDQLATGVPEC